MKHGICLLSVIPGRSEPNDRSEMVTQLLFGELAEIKKVNEKWIQIKTLHDKYQCWVDKQQIVILSEKEFNQLSHEQVILTEDVFTPIHDLEKDEMFPILLGSRLSNLNKEGNRMTIGKRTFEIHGHFRTTNDKANRSAIINDALLYLNSPYLWGGRSPVGIDCSGFVQVVYALNGIQLPRDAYQQAEVGQPLSFIEEAEEGDLAFFDNEDGKIVHVGIMMKDHRIIHASGKVRIDRMDHQGIYRNETKDYSHKLRIIKKIF